MLRFNTADRLTDNHLSDALCQTTDRSCRAAIAKSSTGKGRNSQPLGHLGGVLVAYVSGSPT